MNRVVVKVGAVQAVFGALLILFGDGFSFQMSGISLFANEKIDLTTKLIFAGAMLAPLILVFIENKIAAISISFSSIILYVLTLHFLKEQVGINQITNGGVLYLAGVLISLFGEMYLDVIESDLWQFLMERKKWWLLPMIIVLLLIGVLVVIGGGSAVAPFVYTLF